jgi:hypothetical protein
MVTLGEGWHNNHHHYPAAARNGFFWWEIDITYYTLKVLEACGIIWDLRQVPVQLLDENLVDARPRVVRAEMPASIRTIASARPRISLILTAIQNTARPNLPVTDSADTERVALCASLLQSSRRASMRPGRAGLR